MTNKRLLFILIPAVGLLVLGYSAYNYFRAPPGAQQPAASAAKATGGPPGGLAVAVEATRAATELVTEEVTAVGNLRSNESVVVRPEISGRIAQINFVEGSRVEKGAVLVALDASIQEAEVQQARASLALAQQNLKRTEELLREGFISRRALDEAVTNLKVSEANAALAEAKLGKTRIRAPFGGVIGIRQVSVGDYVKEGQDLVTLEDISSLKVDFRIPEVFLARLAKGQQLTVASDALPARSFSATVDAIDPLIDDRGRALLLRARLANADGQLRPGMFVRVSLILAERPAAIVIPEEALVPVGNDQFVFRVVEGKAQRTKVTVGVRRAGKVEIREGLAAGELVVTAGQIKLRDGAPVKTTGQGGGGAAAVPAAGGRGKG